MIQVFSLVGILSVVATSLLTGCSNLPNNLTHKSVSSIATLSSSTIAPLQHAYDYRLIDSRTQQILTVKQLARQLQKYDVVFMGEFHGNHASHLLETQVMAALHTLRPLQILSMEMFNRDQKPILNRYLDSEVGEAFLINKTPTWGNYAASYRPLIEYAKQNFIPVVAANASADIVRCIGRQGSAYLDKLPTEERSLIASQPFTNQAEYRQRYMGFLEDVRTLSVERKENSYLAQLTRDNTMAESIYQAWLQNPQAQILHINGSFHSENHLGTVGALKNLNPDLKIAVISPVRVEDPTRPNYLAEDLTKGNFIYLLQSQPDKYVGSAYKRQARKNMFETAEQNTCR
ncbi:MAG: ChaN family lipoprotein [Thiomicrorhabdus sp.]|jgi:uncharacterized iron-regulated protein|nr:ChaN family lipoprotein [Thiomicrorhabdus sp.]